MRKIDEIIIHCSATPEGRDHSLADVTAWHRARGVRTIGYQYLVHIDGRVERGRPESEIGAHCLGHNARSIGVCYVGGLASDCKTPKDTRTPEQRRMLRELVKGLQRKYRGAKVYGHRDFAAKACPCFDVATEL